MSIVSKQNKNETIVYPCPKCAYGDFCKYVEDVRNVVGQKMDHGRFRYICDLFVEEGKDSRQRGKTSIVTIEKESNDIQREELIKDTGIHEDDCRRIEECPICKSKNVLAIRCKECNRFVCTKCGELSDVFTGISDDDGASIIEASEFVCYDCDNSEVEETGYNHGDIEDDIVIVTNENE